MKQQSNRLGNRAGFILLPVILAMSLIAAIAFLLNRDNGINAAMVQSQGDADRARYAAEAGLQVVNAVIQSKDCKGYPSITSPKTGNFGAVSYSAYANPASGRNITLTSRSSFNTSSVTLTRESVIAYKVKESANIAPSQDTYIDILDSWNHSSEDFLMVNSGQSALLQFNLDSFAEVVLWSATLALYPAPIPVNPDAVNLYRLIESWDKDHVTWTSVKYDPTPVASSTDSGYGWRNFDVKDLVLAWQSGSYQNFGVILKANVGAYFSRNSSNKDFRPKLILTYNPRC